jgi:hypothetical protein
MEVAKVTETELRIADLELRIGDIDLAMRAYESGSIAFFARDIEDMRARRAHYMEEVKCLKQSLPVRQSE